MGREIRRVPPGWEHPLLADQNRYLSSNGWDWTGQGRHFQPLFDEDYETALRRPRASLRPAGRRQAQAFGAGSTATSRPQPFPRSDHDQTWPPTLRRPADLPAQVADILHVSRETVTRWAKAGRLPVLKTLGGHHRFPEAEIRALAAGNTFAATEGVAR